MYRAPLLAALDAGLEHKLILIAAAAGFGKTTLLADWSIQRAEEIAWFSLDEGDNDPARFLSYLVAAIQTRHPQIGQELLARFCETHPLSRRMFKQELQNLAEYAASKKESANLN